MREREREREKLDKERKYSVHGSITPFHPIYNFMSRRIIYISHVELK